VGWAIVALATTPQARAQLSASPSSLTFSNCRAGGGTLQQTLNLSTPSGEKIPFASNVLENQGRGWLSVTPESDSAPATVAVRINTNVLAGGVFTGAVRYFFQVGGADRLLQVNVTAICATDPPRLTTLNPASGLPGQSFTLTVTGSNFLPGIVVFLNGQALATTRDSATEMRAQVPGDLILTPGTYAITAQNPGSAVSNQLNLPVAGPSARILTNAPPEGLLFNAVAGSTTPQTLSLSYVASDGSNRALSAQAQSSGWLSVELSANQTPGTAQIRVNPAGLAAGNYSGAVIFTSAVVINSPVIVPVTLTVTNVPNLTANPPHVEFSVQPGGAMQTAPVSLASGGTPLPLQASVQSTGWLAANLGAGASPATLTVTATPGALAAGVYQGSVRISAAGAANSPLTIPVTLTVGTQNRISVSAAALSFSAAAGQSPAPQALAISSTVSGLTFTARSDATWLSAGSGITPANVPVAVNTAALTPGQYSGSLSISAAGAANSPVTVNVTLTVFPAGARPSVTAVANGASFGEAIAPGMWITIRGANLSPVTREIRSDEFVNGRRPTEADGVSVLVNNRPAFLHYLSPTQLNVVSPDDSAAGPVTVTVTVNGQTSAAFTATLQRVAPAFFLWPDNQVVATSADFQLRVRNGTFPGAATTAARPGEVIILWGTGFGPVAPPVPAGAVAAGTSLVAGTVRVTVGGVEAPYFGGALAPGFTALYQLAIQIPANAPDGELPVIATVDGVASPATAVISVRR
jgi:uncharacterized protein (TIGR03437 family)